MPSLELVEEAEPAAAPSATREAEAEERPRLAIVDPSRLRRDCLKLAVAGEGWRATDMPAVRDLLRRLTRGEVFDAVVIGGASCAAIDAAQVARLAAAAPLVPILVAADWENDRHAERILAAGACGVLPANASLQMLVSALARLCSGASVPPGWAPPETVPAPAPRALTRRQREVLALISEGKSNKLIAAALALSEDTVKAHVKQIIRRLAVANRTQAALVATGVGRPPQAQAL
ncbi:MAG TPA: response regulator transcription factor [Stellaceae bacterium]|nr:response regulator transcription factor [Stellaceae bacterium]